MIADELFCLFHFMTKTLLHIALLVAMLVMTSCQNGTKHSALSVASNKVPDQVDFNFHVKPILSDRCFTCHGPDENTREAGLSFHLEDLAKAALGTDKDRYAIIPGDVINSTLVQRIEAENPEDVMPPPESNTGCSTQ